jgi:hypothetical protein
MKKYHVVMGAFDVAVLVILQFWTGYSMACLVDEMIPVPEKKADVNHGLVHGEILLQVILLGYLYALLGPMFQHVGNPVWRLSQEDPKSAYKMKLPFQLVTAHFLIMGMTFGSTNLWMKLQMVARPDQR